MANAKVMLVLAGWLVASAGLAWMFGRTIGLRDQRSAVASIGHR
jgi:hypothetical protein